MILIFKQLEKYQNEYDLDNLNLLSLQSYLLAISNVPHFSTEKGPVIISEMTDFWRQILAISHDVEFIFLITSLLVCWGELFSRIYRDGLRSISHNIWRLSKCQKLNTAIMTFQQGSIISRWKINIKPCVKWPTKYKVGDTDTGAQLRGRRG